MSDLSHLEHSHIVLCVIHKTAQGLTSCRFNLILKIKRLLADQFDYLSSALSVICHQRCLCAERIPLTLNYTFGERGTDSTREARKNVIVKNYYTYFQNSSGESGSCKLIEEGR